MSGHFTILMYHMVTKPVSKDEVRYACPPKRFAMHMEFLRTKGFNLASIEDIEQFVSGRRDIPANTVSVTIDDGFMDNYQNAFPILQEYGVPATIFITSGLMGKTNLWMEEQGFPRRKMLSWSQIQEMSSAGITFGSHTVTHSHLPQLSTRQAREEIAVSKKVIEDRLGRSVKYFSYPFGQTSKNVRSIVENARYVLAYSTSAGHNNCYTDRYQLQRIEVYGTDSVWKLSLKLRLGARDMRGLVSRIMSCSHSIEI